MIWRLAAAGGAVAVALSLVWMYGQARYEAGRQSVKTAAIAADRDAIAVETSAAVDDLIDNVERETAAGIADAARRRAATAAIDTTITQLREADDAADTDILDDGWMAGYLGRMRDVDACADALAGVGGGAGGSGAAAVPGGERAAPGGDHAASPADRPPMSAAIVGPAGGAGRPAECD